MDATAHVVARGGVDALSLRQVASGCGTSTNAVYALFGSRDGLLSAVMMEAVRSFTAEQRAVAETTDALADLLELGRAYRRWALAHPELYAVMFGGRISLGAADDPAERIPEGPLSGMQPIVEVIERGAGTGTMRVRDSVTAAGLPGRFTTNVLPVTPTSPRVSAACGDFRRPCSRNISGMPGSSRSSTVAVASGVWSRGDTPVPPVVTMRRACEPSTRRSSTLTLATPSGTQEAVVA